MNAFDSQNQSFLNIDGGSGGTLSIETVAIAHTRSYDRRSPSIVSIVDTDRSRMFTIGLLDILFMHSNKNETKSHVELMKNTNFSRTVNEIRVVCFSLEFS